MQIPFYQVDAFTSAPFAGNPAGVCPLEGWLDAGVMQKIAAENNLSETAFFVADGDAYDLRWFTPAVEVDLCGHATLASAHVLFAHLDAAGGGVAFQSRSGRLAVAKVGDRLRMDFPAMPATPRDDVDSVAAALGAAPEAVLAADDVLAVLPDEEAVRRLSPNMAKVAALDCRGVIATAPGGDCDFVSRFFAPGAGVDEDPVTGSAHCTLIPYWSKRLDKTEMFARQVSARGGEIWCEDRGERVGIAGRAVTVVQGTITL